jgi:riboflavin-specific deaminase-like protein
MPSPGAAAGTQVPGLRLDAAWRLLLAVRDAPGVRALGLTASGRVCPAAPEDRSAVLRLDGAGRWAVSARGVSSPARELLDLYLPLCGGPRGEPLAVAHLGQSLDGRIATAEGVSRYVTGPENIVHMHRLRALCDAVVVGAETVRRDDPRLTTRLVPGRHPVRVVVDPHRRLSGGHRLFSDGVARTLVVCMEGRRAPGPDPGQAEVIEVPHRDGSLDLAELLRRLRAMGLTRVFIEGGGFTVSRFLEQGLLDRLHVAVAPLILGSGRPGISLPPVASLDDALRPVARVFPMGSDVLFDCDLRHPAASPERPPEDIDVPDRQ